ncbi:MAG: GTPase ObgE [bacterium]
MFIDKARIFVAAGAGGNGCVSFKREKYVPNGGPDGADGGKGGDVILKASHHLSTLVDFQYRPQYKADRGSHGKGRDKTGRDGEDLIVKIPVGTVVREVGNNNVIADLVTDGQEVVIARGGRGGKGNSRFKTNKRRAPRIAEKGEPGDEITVSLELKLIADVGLVGYPNAGKSTLLSRVSSAHPKIADYPFTTLTPQLGVVKIDEGSSFVLADIPGLIEGAHRGVGLGDDFLRHIERTRILVHIVDVTGYDGKAPAVNFHAVTRELALYSKKLADKKQVIALNKTDILQDEKTLAAFRRKVKGYKIFPVSAVTGKGVKELLKHVYSMLGSIPVEEAEVVSYKEYSYVPDFEVKKHRGVFVVKGKQVERLVAMTNMDEEESLRRMQRILVRIGVEEALVAQGIAQGDTVRIGPIEFTFEK